MIGDDRVLEDGYLACPGVERDTLTHVKEIGRPPHRQRQDKVGESQSEGRYEPDPTKVQSRE